MPAAKLPEPGTVVVDTDRGEVILSAAVQFPEGKPCINEYGERIQAFAGCAKAAGGDAKMAAYFVFLVDVATEQVFDGLMKVGCRPLVHYSIQEGRKRAGLTSTTPAENYLQGDPVVLSVFWKNSRWNMGRAAVRVFCYRSHHGRWPAGRETVDAAFRVPRQRRAAQFGNRLHCLSLRLPGRDHCRQSVSHL